MLLAIDTATRTAGLALYDQDGLHLEQMWRTCDNHTVELMPHVVRACDQQGLLPDALRVIAVSLGPGSFTGLRVGLSIAKGLTLALGIPLIGVPTLDATAYAHSRETLPVCAVLQAGRQRLCVGFYRAVSGTWKRQGDYTLMSPQDLAVSLTEPTLLCGEIDGHLVKALRMSGPNQVIVADPALSMRRAGYLAELAWQRFTSGECDDPISLSPIYLQHS